MTNRFTEDNILFEQEESKLTKIQLKLKLGVGGWQQCCWSNLD